MSTPRAIIDAHTTEAEFQWQLMQLARLCGFMCYHPFDSRRSAIGYPDLTLVHAERGQLVFLEAKRESGKTTPAQDAWLIALGAVPGVVARAVRPSDWETIAAILTGDG
jgi:hypothetical protein